jgi:hypothetical protein
MTLESKLDALKADFEAGKRPYKVPHFAIEVMHQATAKLLASGLVDKAPAFTLPDPNCVEISLVNLLRKSVSAEVALTFERGRPFHQSPRARQHYGRARHPASRLEIQSSASIAMAMTRRITCIAP